MRDLEAGITYINAGTTGAEVHLPFGGTKETATATARRGRRHSTSSPSGSRSTSTTPGKLQRAQIDNREARRVKADLQIVKPPIRGTGIPAGPAVPSGGWPSSSTMGPRLPRLPREGRRRRIASSRPQRCSGRAWPSLPASSTSGRRSTTARRVWLPPPRQCDSRQGRSPARRRRTLLRPGPCHEAARATAAAALERDAAIGLGRACSSNGAVFTTAARVAQWRPLVGRGRAQPAIDAESARGNRLRRELRPRGRHERRRSPA